MSTLVLPHTITAGTEIVAADHQDNYVAIRDLLNGGLDTANLTAAMVGQWRTVHEANGTLGNGVAAGNYYFADPGVQLHASGTSTQSSQPFRFDPADYALAGRTTQIRIVAAAIRNATAFGTLTMNLYPISALAGGPVSITLTLGTAVAGLGAALNDSVSFKPSIAGAAITAPAADTYMPGISVPAAMSGNTWAAITWALQVRLI